MPFARGAIDADAERVVRRLARAGYQAYLVGGCVRDILLEREPKDFDVATSATPNEIKQLFRNCRIIGRRFRLAHVFFGAKIIETSTFRANPRPDEDADEGELLIRRDNVFGTDTEDARRRDFTINGLFYDVELDSVIDHVGGLADLEARLIRTIGDPEIRFQEDPVRMLRAIKFAARLDFGFEAKTYDALIRHRDEIRKCAAPRVIEELYRLLRGGAARRSMELLLETGVADILSPQLASMFRKSAEAPPEAQFTDESAQEPAFTPYQDEDPEEAAWRAVWLDEEPRRKAADPAPKFAEPDKLLEHRAAAWRILEQIDQLAHGRAELDNALLLAVLIHPFIADSIVAPRTTPGQAAALIFESCQPLIEQLRVARRDSEKIRQVLLAQRRLDPSRRRRSRPSSLAGREFFDDALSLYELSGRARGIDVAEVAALRPHAEATDPADGSESVERKRRRRRRGGRRRRRNGEDEGYGEAGLDDEAEGDDEGDDAAASDELEEADVAASLADSSPEGDDAPSRSEGNQDEADRPGSDEASPEDGDATPHTPRRRTRRRRSRRLAVAADDDASS